MRFSVGRIKVGIDTYVKCSGITIRVDGAPVEYYGGGYKFPLEIEQGNSSITVSVDLAEWGTINPETVLPNQYVDVELLASADDPTRGMSGITVTRCKATSWEAASTQDGFVTYRLELRHAQAT